MAVLGLKVNNAELQKQIDNIVEREVYAWESAAKKALKEVREQAVKTWYEGNRSGIGNFNESTHYNVTKSGTGRNSNMVTITIESYIDSEEYAARILANQANAKIGNWTTGIEAWKERHSKDGWTYYGKKNGIPHPAISMHYTTGEYLVQLIWDKGTVGLPAGARETGTQWVNPSPPKSREPLREVVQRKINSDWEKKTLELHG